MKPKRLLLAVLALLAVALGLAFLDPPVIGLLARLAVAGALVFLVLWGAWRLYQGFLWKVGRRLAFSYFLIGVLPIPLVLMVLAAVAYIQAGYFLGHLYRDAVRDVHADLQAVARERLAEAQGGPGLEAVASAAGAGEESGREGENDGEAGDAVVFALYRGGSRIAGDPRLPAAWPAWVGEADGRVHPLGHLEAEIAPAAAGSSRTAAAPEPPERRSALPTFFGLADGEPTLASAAGDPSLGVVVVYVGNLARELSERSDVWVRIYGPAGDPAAQGRVDVRILGREMALKTDPRRTPGGAEAFFAARAESSTDSGWLDRQWDRPFLWWGEVPGPLLALDDGRPVADNVGIGLNAPPRTLERHLFSSSAELDVSVWSALFVFAFLLFDVYAAAALMAGVMIFALSRAVNRLSSATEAVRGGDFSIRIPVRRRDQVGELQRSFNTMSENLEQLVATATQKELLEKELAIARDLQQSLVPQDLPTREGVEFASLFEPSAAIGGDYFDILRLGEDRLAVAVADVSGHGLPTGLRMAMLKAALTILVSEERPVEEMLRKLDQVVRLDRRGAGAEAGREARYFVTATVALLDFRDGSLQITNAGHPPTYVVRGTEVREVLLPGSPLGGLGQEWGTERLELRADDVVVWLSDGLIEAPGAGDEPFGYGGVEGALRGMAERAGVAGRGLRAVEVRDGLVRAVAEHSGGRSAQDDRTLVVMRYLG